MRLSIHIVTKNRNDCLALLLESFRKQTYNQWDLIILDNNNGITEAKVNQHFLCQSIFNRLQYEGHRVHIIDNSQDTGERDIGRYRNMIIEKDAFNNTIGVRIDDDSILELNYLEIIENGFKDDNIGIVGGIVPYYWAITQHRLLPAKFNEVLPSWDWTDDCIFFYRMLDEKGYDKHWLYTYYESGHIRSSYAYRIDLAKKLRFPEWTGSSGFTEETIFCCKVWMSGYKILINPNAICWHLNTPYGGGRDTIKSQEQMNEIKEGNQKRLKEELTEFRKALNLEERSYP